MSLMLNSIAVLIDGDNASASSIECVLQKIATFGRITRKNIYGDWGNAHIQNWRAALLTHAIEPVQHFAYVKGKNATDIGLVIDAMDMLYSGDYDGFCLISSDSDFTSLALRIRKNQINVFGFGRRSTVQAFTQACDDFYYIEDLDTPKTIDKPTDNPHKDTVTTPAKPAIKTPPALLWSSTQLQTQTHLISVINKLIKNAPNSDNHWVSLSYVASQIKQHHSNVHLEKYGYKKFSDLIRATDLYEVRLINKTLCLSIKPKKTIASDTNPTNGKNVTSWDAKQLKCDTKLLNSLRASIIHNPNSEAERWVNLGAVGQAVKDHFPEFTPQSYGYTKLIGIIKKIGLFETKTVNSTLYVRQKIASSITTD